MGKKFEDDFMELQSGLISLCLEVAGEKVDRVYVYCSIEKKSKMFNAFFQIKDEIKTINQLGVEGTLMMQFLKLGTSDLEKIKTICRRYNMPVPTEMKMCYNTKTGKYDAQYKYEEICSEKTGVNAGEVFLNWISEVKYKK